MLPPQVNCRSPSTASPGRGRPRRLGLYADARGTVTIFFAVWCLVIFGLAAVGVDGGFWYLLRRQGQSAADMAAVAGVEALVANQGTAAAQSAGQMIASNNGFTNNGNANVAINIPPSIGSYSSPTTSDAVEAIIYHQAPFLLTSLVRAFAGITGQTIGTRAVAALTTRPGNVCLLSLNGDLTFSGSSVTTGNNCVLASNASDPTSINLGNNGLSNTQVSAYSLLSSGGCYRCSNSNVGLVQPYTIYQPPTQDPYESLNTLDFSTYETSNPITGTNSSTTTYSPGYYAHGIHISGNGGAITLQSGLYVLGNNGGNALQIDSGYSVTCTACTFVVLSGGTLDINGSIVQFSANSTDPSPYDSLDGMLFYVQPTTSKNGNAVNNIINGDSGSFYSGGIYMPTGDLTFNGNEDTTAAGYPNPSAICTQIVASTVTLTGNGSTGITNVDNQACTGTAAQSPEPRIVRIVE